MLLQHQTSSAVAQESQYSKVLRLLSPDRKEAWPTLDDVLGALLLAEDLADRYAAANGRPAGTQSSEDASTAEAFDWVQTAFQDIAATLEAISRVPSAAGRAKV